MKKSNVAVLFAVLVAIVTVGGSCGGSSQESAATPSRLAIPTNTPSPMPTDTPSPVPSDTPTPVLPTATPTPDTRESDYLQGVREVRAVYVQFASGMGRSLERLRSNPALVLDPNWRNDLDSQMKFLDQAAAGVVILVPPPGCEGLHGELQQTQQQFSDGITKLSMALDSLDSDMMWEGASSFEQGLKHLGEVDSALQTMACK